MKVGLKKTDFNLTIRQAESKSRFVNNGQWSQEPKQKSDFPKYLKARDSGPLNKRTNKSLYHVVYHEGIC
jgi:hypothetical protein